MEQTLSKKIRVREVEVRRIVGKKNVKNKTYSYEYYTLS